MAPPAKRRPGHSRRAQYSLFLAYVLAIGGATLGLLLVVLSQFDPPAFAALRSAAAEIFMPVSSGADRTRRGIGSIPQAIGDYIRAGSQNDDLRRRLIAEQRLVRQARSLAYENARLRRLVRLQEGATDAIVTARLVSSTGSSTRRFGTLNAGRRHGVLPGQPVRGPDGLVGRVVETGINVSRVMLVTDPESVIPVRRARDGLPAFAYGHGDGLVEIRGVTTGVNAFRAGDQFVTSGAGGVFAPGTPVAQVTRPLGDSALARPFAHPDRLDFAVVQPIFLAAPPAPAGAEEP
ncbi:rod shape-determining protein MreC [Sphingomonas gilva]|uniref:Cell shape-determining protein MreC n=1 Tax=Sphingomonas gilva TaxID=2305907 RepID=A0A396RJU8_9SPHN|nr:rod shape-determining protein MreC [Sphingomonas gilva]RHW16467.1 rod shape-determining protein MreC [Sphingomonas gilva]